VIESKYCVRVAWKGLVRNDKYASKLRIKLPFCLTEERLCGLVVRVLGYRSGGPGSIPGTTRFSGGRGEENSSGSGTGCTQSLEYN
jgi:hypothetical protein